MASYTAFYVTRWNAAKGEPSLPPLNPSETVPLALALRDGDGYSVKSYVPGASTCIVEVRADSTTQAALKADEASYLWIADVEEG